MNRQKQVSRFIVLVIIAWCTMLITHELGHVMGGLCCGGTLISVDLRPWRMPYGFFAPDPHPLVTLWSGLLLGALGPLLAAYVIRKPGGWFVAYFCLLANGSYIAVAWFTGDIHLDTARLLKHGAHPIGIATYCIATIGIGYVGFRRACIELLQPRQRSESP